MNSTATPESIALAAGILTQTRGDVAQARRAAAEATEWLQSIDPSYKALAPAQAVDKDQEIAKLQVDIAVARAAADQRAAERDQWEDRALIAEEARAQLTAELDGYKLREKIAQNNASKPAPAPVASTPAPAPAPDAFANLPPKMRAFLTAQQNKGLEID